MGTLKKTLFDVNPAKLARRAAAEIRRLHLEKKLIGVDLDDPGGQVWEPLLSRLVAGEEAAFQMRYLKLSREIEKGGEAAEALLWHQVFIWALYHDLGLDDHFPIQITP